jgi:NDP-sugar pyrophosphorylase family protein
MKAIILAAGLGSRLGKYTENIPKPMIKFNNKPILQHNIELCKKYGINDIYINLYYLPEKIIEYFGNGNKFGVNIYYNIEEKLLGTSGGVKNIFEKFNFKDEPFYIIYGDNYSDFNLNSLKTNAFGKIAFHYREDVFNSGVAEFEITNKIIKFIEKPKIEETKSHWVNAGIYYFQSDIIKYIPNGYSDFGKDIFPTLLSLNRINIYGEKQNIDVRSFDTPSMLEKNINL